MSKHTRTAHCRLTAFGEAVLTFPYSAQLVADLKSSIPFRFRAYDDASKTWTIEPAYADLAIEILAQHFPDAEVPRRARKTHSTADSWTTGSNHFEALHLLPSAPPELVSAAFRCLAKIHHPDKGGDPAVMRAPTKAHEALSRRLSA